MIELKKDNDYIFLNGVNYKYGGYNVIDSDSLSVRLDEHERKFYWNDTTIDGKTFDSLFNFMKYFEDNFTKENKTD